MINVEKYIDNPVTEEDLSKVFTPQIVDKANTYIAKFQSNRTKEIVSEFFQDPDCKYMMGYLAEKDFDLLFLNLENEVFAFSSLLDKKVLDFDWEVKEGICFANYYFIKNYNILYSHSFMEGVPEMTSKGYMLTIISYNSSKKWEENELPFNSRMKFDFFQNLQSH